MDAFVSGLRATSALELVSVVLGVVYALLAVRQHRQCWVFGGLSSAILIYLAAGSRLPMQALLQACYVAMSFYGFWRWSHEAADVSSRITIWSARNHGLAVVIVIVATAVLAPGVAAWTGAAWPRLDTATMLASLLATWMVARSKLENWLYWIVIDLISLFLYAAQSLYFVAVLYGAYLVIAVIGYFTWRERYRAARAVH